MIIKQTLISWICILFKENKLFDIFMIIHNKYKSVIQQMNRNNKLMKSNININNNESYILNIKQSK